MRPMLLVAAFLALQALSGCSGPDRPVSFAAYAAEHRLPPADEPVLRHPSLLFDRVSGQPTATAFDYRSDWPSTAVGTPSGETIYYMTYVRDHYGHGWHDGDDYHRSARYYQVGVLER